MWYIYTMDYYSAIKKNKSEPVVIQSEVIQKQKNKYSILTPQFKRINSSVLSFLHSPTLTSIHDHRKNHSLD